MARSAIVTEKNNKNDGPRLSKRKGHTIIKVISGKTNLGHKTMPLRELNNATVVKNNFDNRI